MFHIDQALALIGYGQRRIARRFANGELMLLIGEAERAGHQTPSRIAQFVMAAKGIDQTDRKLVGKIRFSVKDCRKRMSARGA